MRRPIPPRSRNCSSGRWTAPAGPDENEESNERKLADDAASGHHDEGFLRDFAVPLETSMPSNKAGQRTPQKKTKTKKKNDDSNLQRPRIQSRARARLNIGHIFPAKQPHCASAGCRHQPS
jgi:hypothetical protein